MQAGGVVVVVVSHAVSERCGHRNVASYRARPSGRKIRWRPALLGPGLGEFRSALAASPASELTGSSNLFRGGLGLARLLHRIAGLRLLGATDDDDY